MEHTTAAQAINTCPKDADLRDIASGKVARAVDQDETLVLKAVEKSMQGSPFPGLNQSSLLEGRKMLDTTKEDAQFQ